MPGLPAIIPSLDPISTAWNVFQFGLTLFQGSQEQEAQKAAAKAQADYYEALAKQQEEEIQLSGKQAGKEQSQLRQASTILSETQKAAIAGSGASLSSVTAEDIAYSSLSAQLKDEMAIKYNADILRQRQLKQAEQYRKAGSGAIKAGEIQSFNTLLKTASQVGQQFIPKGY